MLLLPLVENSFKHGISGDAVDGFIRIHLRQEKNRVQFTIENNKGIPSGLTEHREGGVGLKNIRNRLHLIYPDNHTFEVTEKDLTFMVELTIISNV
jgi:sensor histidine kinase YesM